jgi:hypothetical protein
MIITAGALFVFIPTALPQVRTVPLVIRGDRQVAGFQTHDNLGAALEAFGTPSARRELAGYQRFCVVRWDKIGLEMRFFARGCAREAAFVGARATGPRWQTIRRLRVGDPAARVRALYPDASPRRVATGLTEWRIFRRGTTTAGLTATAEKGRVVALIVTTAFFTFRWS